MHECAREAKISADGKAGILIHDEIKIQEDLVLDSRDNKLKLVGWVESGDEGDCLRALKADKLRQTLATEVIQFYFLGHTGFRFPICHYPTSGISAHELYTITWNIIAKLHDWGFSIVCVLQDGAGSNRQFIKTHFIGSPSDKHYLTVNVVDRKKPLGLCQDFSHNMKKIRNGIMKSGDDEKLHTRKLQLHGKYIVWQHWISAAQWNRLTNSRLIHHKLSNSHLFPNSSEKMRNHLAEEMLNADALNLLQCYRGSCIDGSQYDSTIELLKHTSKIIEVFRDMRPITELTDNRLLVLKEVLEWFQAWKKEALSNKEVPNDKRKRSLLSTECSDDIESLLMCFPEICQIHLKNFFPTGSIVPSRFNTDIVENHFCQQRGLHNGNSTNPSYYGYCSTTNSIILGQSCQSRGRKSNAGLMPTKPFNFYVHKPLVKKQKL